MIPPDLTPFLLAALIAGAGYALAFWSRGQTITPDGRMYLMRAQSGCSPPAPYHARWLLPWVLGGHIAVWKLTTAASLVLLGPALVWFLTIQGLSAGQSLLGVVFLVGLPGVFRIGAAYPVLTDAPGMLLALVSACLALEGFVASAVLVAIVGATVRETTPAWAAVFAWNPWLLLGLVPVALANAIITPGPIPGWAETWLRRPLGAARDFHHGAWHDPAAMLLPWGVLPFLVLWGAPGSLTAPLVVAAALGYGSLLAANDRCRLYQQSAPLVILAAVPLVPAGWEWILAAAHLFNPWQEQDT